MIGRQGAYISVKKQHSYHPSQIRFRDQYTITMFNIGRTVGAEKSSHDADGDTHGYLIDKHSELL